MEKISRFKTVSAYADAWLQASKDAGVLDKVFVEAKEFGEVLKKDAKLWDYLSIPLDNNKDNIDVVATIAKAGKLSKITTEVLKIMAENNRLNLASAVVDEFIHLYYKDKNITEVSVKTATKLSDKQNKKLKSVLEEKLGNEVVIDYVIDESVIGGLSVSFDSYLIDDTVKYKLEKIKQILFVK